MIGFKKGQMIGACQDVRMKGFAFYGFQEKIESERESGNSSDNLSFATNRIQNREYAVIM